MHPLDTLYTIIPSSASLALGLATAYDDDGQQKAGQFPRRGKLAHLPEDECAVCYENAATTLNIIGDIQPQSTSDINLTSATRKGEPPTHPLTTPYRASCGHIYCYACVAEKLLRAADEGAGPWVCLRCGMPVLGAERFHVESMYWATEGDDASVEEWGSDYFDEMGSSSLSGVSGMSAGSRSWASGSDEEQSELG
jgi:peroxin-2